MTAGLNQNREAAAERSRALENTGSARSNQRGADTPGRQEFQRSLQVLGVIASWHTRCSSLMLALLPGAIILVAFNQRYATFLVQGLLGAMWLVSGFALYGQRHRLKLLRNGLVEQMNGATKSHVRAEKLYGLSIIDPLTGLYNRRFGADRLEEEIGRAGESEDPLLLLAIDFDKFKEINDKHGHGAGDLALREFSRRLQKAVRACDVPIRVGGDEFLVILPECPPEKVQVILSRIGSILLEIDNKKIPLFFSCGIAQHQVGDTPEIMIKRADQRLYEVKAKRKAEAAMNQAAATPSSANANDTQPPSDKAARSHRIAESEVQGVRRDIRLSRETPIVLIGSDLSGRTFSEQTYTIELSCHGAGIISRHKFAPEQEIIVRCLATNREADARIVRVIGSKSGRHTYGLEFVSPSANIWDVSVPPLTESEKGANHSVVECAHCKSREVIVNSDFESGGDAAHRTIVRPCKCSSSPTTWTLIWSDHDGARVIEVSGVRS